MNRILVGASRLGVVLHPHQVELGGVLDGAVETTAVQWPRRSGKTLSIWSWLLGYAEEIDDALIMTTAQSGVKARDRFMSVARMVERYWPESDGGPHIYKGAGHEAFEFQNGSRLWVVAPKDGSARGDAADIVFADEQGELAPDASYDLKAGALPLLDTRPQGQVVLAGTPGLDRSGWFWDSLQAGMQDQAGHTASVHAADEGDDVDDEAVWLRVHPGIDTLTTLEKMRARRAGMDRETWGREYMGLWPGSSDTRAIGEAEWAAGLAAQPERPDRFGLAFDVAPDSSVAALVAAWRDGDGTAWVALLEYGTPREVGREALRIHRKYRVPITYDEIGANLEVADGLKRARPAPRLDPLSMRDVVTAATVFHTALREGELRHGDQAALNAAAEAATWRDTGDSGRLFGRRRSTGDVTPVVAASLALLAFDRLPAPEVTRIITRRSA